MGEDIAGSIRGAASRVQRNDFVRFPVASGSLVIATPSFVAHWLHQGVVPDIGFITNHLEDFVEMSDRDSSEQRQDQKKKSP